MAFVPETKRWSKGLSFYASLCHPIPGSQRKSLRTTWWIVGLELEVLKNSWRRKVTKVRISAANPRLLSVLIDDELLQLV